MMKELSEIQGNPARGNSALQTFFKYHGLISLGIME